ncbi:MAG: hypothetical protein ACFE0Q_16360 [Anaerolineae bacterium]
MSKLKRLAPRLCPDCGARDTLFVDHDRQLTCQLCGYKALAKDTTTPAEQDTPPRWQVSYRTPYTSQIDRWAQVKFTSALDYVHQGNYTEAMRAFEQALDQQADLVEAHLWLARLTPEPERKHLHYSEVFARVPNHLEARRELLVLKGDLTRAEADRTLDMSQEPDVRTSQGAVATEMIEIVCVNCGGTLQVPADSDEVTCKFCGYVEPLADHESLATTAPESLTTSLLKERAQGVKWVVGQHLLHCDQCGAERIITSDKMTTQCPFCASQQVIKSDALQSFRQPDGIVPFQMNREMARAELDESLNSFTERFKGWFVNNQVVQVQLTPAYLPFWFFDVNAQIRVTKVGHNSQQNLVWNNVPNVRTEFGDALSDVPYCAVLSPPHRLTDRLHKYDLTAIKPYHPKMLAGATAELYSIDFADASLKVRSEIAERFRFRHRHNPNGDYQIHVSHLITDMAFRLLLLPVWVGILTEDDADIRPLLIHGQTGQVILGTTTRPDA